MPEIRFKESQGFFLAKLVGGVHNFLKNKLHDIKNYANKEW